jgi:hypothetical protein
VLASYPLATVIDSFATSPESQALYGNQTPVQVITAVYANLFGRAPDAGGLAYWSGLVATGQLTQGRAIFAVMQGAVGTDADSVAAKVDAANVLTYSATGYGTSSIPAARAWLAGILTKSQVQPAVEALPC